MIPLAAPMPVYRTGESCKDVYILPDRTLAGALPASRSTLCMYKNSHLLPKVMFARFVISRWFAFSGGC